MLNSRGDRFCYCIVGTATNVSGGALSGVKVVATNVDTKMRYSAVTSGSGDYTIILLPPGRYTLTAELTEFKSWVANQIELAIGDRLRLDPKLGGWFCNPKRHSYPDTPALQNETSSVCHLVDQIVTQDLPLNGRNFIRLGQIAPGASEEAVNAPSGGNRHDDRRQSSSIVVNGQDSSLNNFLIDGLDDNERFIGTIVVKPSIDAIEEMKVDTNSYAAELGRTAGGVINIVTRPGTNNFHDTLYEFFRNSVLDAKKHK
jgi:hypothetical protein